MNSASIAVERLKQMLNPINSTRFAKQCLQCKFCHVKKDLLFDLDVDHICLLGKDIDSLNICMAERDYGYMEDEK